jgi:hypothetical protein
MTGTSSSTGMSRRACEQQCHEAQLITASGERETKVDKESQVSASLLVLHAPAPRTLLGAVSPPESI